jgi:uncharacterized SAM-binding protein YcdF (DUF218 family)
MKEFFQAAWRFIKTQYLLILAAVCFFYYLTSAAFISFRIAQLWIWLIAGGFFAGIWLWKRFIPKSVTSRKWYRAVRVVLRTAFCLFIALFIAVESLVIVNMFSSEDGDLNYIIILGAKVNDNGPSGALYERIKKAFSYLNAHPGTVAIASGGQGEDEYISEAECIKQSLVSYGIDEKRIKLEDRSTTTAENIRFSSELIPEGSTVGIVSNNFHIFHAKLLAEKYINGKVCGIAAPFPSYVFPHFMVREFLTIVFDALAGNLTSNFAGNILAGNALAGNI